MSTPTHSTAEMPEGRCSASIRGPWPGSPYMHKVKIDSGGASPMAPSCAGVDEPLEKELVLEEGHVVLVSRVGRDQLSGLDQPPAVGQGVDPRAVGRVGVIPGGRGGATGAVIAGPPDHVAVQCGVGQVQEEDLLADDVLGGGHVTAPISWEP